MANIYYPAILYRARGGSPAGITIPGVNVNAGGATDEAALADAGAVLQELIDDFVATGQEVPRPLVPADIDLEEGTLVLIPALVSEKSVRVNVTLPDSLIARIDAVAPNRSAFLAASALEALRKES